MVSPSHTHSDLHSSTPIQPASIIFKPSIQVVEHNTRIIRSHVNLKAAIAAQRNSLITYGSEFRSTSTLQPLILNNGTTFHLVSIDETIRHKDLLATLDYKNHKSTDPTTSSLAKHMSNKIEYG